MKTFRRCCLGLVLAPLLLALPACDRPEDAPPPADLMPREKMIRLLADLHVLEARVESSRLNPDSARALFVAQKKALLWNRDVSDSTFQRSYRYYGIHGKDLSEIYNAVVDTLTMRQGRLAPLPAPPAPVATPAPATPPPPANAAALAK
ncbi:DUF4296 domain-containing protein [Hymenobacter convexus]|uniref:DUF4296 domain-containing protein n=1 Tax=Hymenobacter sp. CA1UV-4 TaxID=3063782 RepID=UPI0027125F93|nr:DUF4296 domain-containing protein [Hymenobacter sp. CA1UV-4]MDO7853879.1 DUF4296 domain-containing protein [Hymenobacter sp. CA1UV-4]